MLLALSRGRVCSGFLLARMNVILLICLYAGSVPLVLTFYLLLLHHPCFNFLSFVMPLYLRLPVTLLYLCYCSDTLGNAV